MILHTSQYLEEILESGYGDTWQDTACASCPITQFHIVFHLFRRLDHLVSENEVLQVGDRVECAETR
jgi:hypothetical protein